MQRLTFCQAAVGFVAMTLTAAASAESSKDRAQMLARDVDTAVGAATGLISELQSKINSGTVTKADIRTETFLADMKAAYEANSDRSFDNPGAPRLKTFHREFADSVRAVLQAYRQDILEGGRDAFVPAFFRAQVLRRVSESMGEGFRAVVTNRQRDLINFDSGVDFVFRDQPTIAHVSSLLEKGVTERRDTVIDNQLVSYFPMTLKKSCVTCHARSGVKQDVGDFGGAMVVKVAVQD